MGLLVVDEIDEPHRSIAGDYPQLYASLFAAAGATIEVFDGRTGPLPDPGSLDGWVIGGSRRSVYDDVPWIRTLQTWVAAAARDRIALVGLCFGHQLIASALGGQVEPWPGGWNIGAVEYRLVDPPRWLIGDDHDDEEHGDGQTVRLLASHQDQVTALPPGARQILTAPRCPIAGFTIDRHVVCLQPHPEFTPDMAASIYTARVDRQGRAVTEAALASLDTPLDAERVARWLVAATV